MPGPSLPGGRGPRQPQDAAEWYDQRKKTIEPHGGLGLTNYCEFLRLSVSTSGTFTATTHRFTPVSPIAQDMELTECRIYVGGGDAATYGDFGLYAYDTRTKTYNLISGSAARFLLVTTGSRKITFQRPVKVKVGTIYAVGVRMDNMATGNITTVRVVSSATAIKEKLLGLSTGLEKAVNVSELTDVASGGHIAHVQYFTANGALLY